MSNTGTSREFLPMRIAALLSVNDESDRDVFL